MPETTYPVTFATVDGRTVTYNESAMCGHCSGSLTDHIARNLACGPGYAAADRFRAWGTDDTLATTAVGQALPENTAVAAALVGVGGRFRITRSDGVAAREYEVMRLPGFTTDEYPNHPENSIVRDVADLGSPPFPIVHNTYRGELVATRVGPETNAQRQNLFIAVAMAGGRDGRIARADGGTLRILAADEDESGQVRVTSSVDDESGAILLRYSEHTDATWTVVAAAESVPDATEPATVPVAPRGIIPVTLDDAEARIAALENLSQWLPEDHNTGGMRMLASLRTVASWLDGGERQQAGHNIAENHPEGELCGAYEGLVCPTFGWSPRRSRGRWQTQLDQWTHNVRAFERQYAHLGAADILARWVDQYAAGGDLNNFANEYIETNLEEHKIRHVADLFGKIGWDAPDAPPEEQDWTVRIPVTRTVTYTETGYAEVTVRARDEDSASEHVSDNYYPRDLVSMVFDWESDDNHDTDDYSAEADFSMAEVTS